VPDDATSAGERVEGSQEQTRAEGFSEQKLETSGPSGLRSLLWLGQETDHSGSVRREFGAIPVSYEI